MSNAATAADRSLALRGLAARCLLTVLAMSHFHEALRKPHGWLLIGAVACAAAWAIWTFVVW